MAIIYGTPGNDFNPPLSGTQFSDTIYADTGNDVLLGLDGIDYLYGEEGRDILDGGPSNDFLRGEEDSDTYVFSGRFGQDEIRDTLGVNTVTFRNLNENDVEFTNRFGDLLILVNGSSDYVLIKDYYDSGLSSNYRFVFASDPPPGGPTPGNDVLTGTSGPDTISALAGDDVVRGGAGNDVVGGDLGNDQLFGELGDDRLYGGLGNDALDGGDGNDLLAGGAGRDTRRGGAGNDTFAFNGSDSTPSSRDTILDFARGDRIDVAAIDANTSVAGNQAFTFVGTARPDAPGEIGVSYSGNTTVVRGTWDRDLTPEFEVVLNGRIALTAADFLL